MNNKGEGDPRIDARYVLQQHFYGVLSTLSQKFPDYPYGSVVPYCLDQQGRPLILVSRLAQHTQNIAKHPKVSLVILDRLKDNSNVQTDARLTLLGTAEKVPDEHIEACATRYYQHFPQAQGYHTELDFEFYVLQLDQMRFIPGFGQARWLSPSEVLLPNPFQIDVEFRMVNHMNEDHQDALLHYLQSAPSQLIELSDAGATELAMTAIDSEGIVIRVDQQLQRIQFPSAVTNPMEARQMLVEMATGKTP
ncbi:MAG: DUF2470 domain-containing protein [Pseudomonadales bacterium]|nr:DUF2470 domain-containing protein [Pseudomonadales bacterium]